MPGGRYPKDENGEPTFSTDPRAIYQREKTLKARKYDLLVAAAENGEIIPASVSSTPADTPAEVPPAGVISHEEIGIKAAPKAKEPEAEEINYFCTTCHHRPIHVGDVECPVCEEKFDWDGVK
jgi:cytochrome c5